MGPRENGFPHSLPESDRPRVLLEGGKQNSLGAGKIEIILTHVSGDFDGLGAMVAASRVFPEAVPVLPDSLDERVQEFVAIHREVLGLKHLVQVDLATVQRVIVVDTQSPARLGTAFPALDRPGVEWVVYDHHPQSAGDLPPGPGRRVITGAATTLLVEELARKQIEISPLEATVMALGVYVDTGSLTFPGTTAADARAVAFLLEQGADLTIIGRYIQTPMALEQQRLVQALLERSPPRIVAGHTVMVAGVAWPHYVEGIALVAQHLVATCHLDLVVLVVEMGGKRTQIVGRSRLVDLDLQALLAAFQPRGHAQAASAHAKGLKAEAAITAIEAALLDALPPEPTAADLMSSPVRTVTVETTLAAAQALLARHGHGALVVMRDGVLAGLISRRDLERADHHGLGGARVKDVMTREVVTVAPDSPCTAIEQTMITRDIGRVPVVYDGALVGIVTRSDVLRVKYHPVRQAAVRHQANAMSRRLAAWWPASWLAVIHTIGEVAGPDPCYIVGGGVRDMLLDRAAPAAGMALGRAYDLDLVAEGDAIALATRAAAALPGSQLRVHAAFGTAQLKLSDGRKVDFATARTEFYTHPAALPTVEFGPIKQDLTRRDFSVNCLAVRLNPGHFGELLDFFGSRRDLEKRVLRVLHNLSFIEDPTRILRAVRFEHQLDFKLEPQSEAYARFALAGGQFDGLAGERIKQELHRILDLGDPGRAIRRLQNLGGLRLLHRALDPGPGTWRVIRHVRRQLGTSPQRWLALLVVLFATLPVLARSEVIQKLHLNRDERDTVVAAVAAYDSLIVQDGLSTLGPLAIYKALRDLGPTGRAVLAALARNTIQRHQLRRYRREWHGLKPDVGGEDLLALGLPPGPRYGQILEAVLEARLEGRIRDEAGAHDLLVRLVQAPVEER